MTGMWPWVSLEGINGVGKTYLARAVAGRLGDICHLVCELPDTLQGTLPAAVIAALHEHGDLFLRTGMPLTETALLCALQIHRWESLAVPEATRVVLEDRGPYSVAVYQAAVIATSRGSSASEAALVSQILRLMSAWRPPPALTVLLVDDPSDCLLRFEQRIGRRADASERGLMTAANALYRELAANQPAGLTVIDRTCLGTAQCIDAITALCSETAAHNPSGGKPPCCPGR